MARSDQSTALRSQRMRYAPIGVGAAIIHLLMMIPGYNEDGDFDLVAWLSVLAVSIILSVIIFSYVVPGGGPVTGVVLGALALATCVIFWAGVTLPLAASAAVVGWSARQRGERVNLANLSLALAALATIALVAIIIGDASSN